MIHPPACQLFPKNDGWMVLKALEKSKKITLTVFPLCPGENRQQAYSVITFSIMMQG